MSGRKYLIINESALKKRPWVGIITLRTKFIPLLLKYAMKSEPSHRFLSKMRLMSVGWLLRKNVKEKCSLLCDGKGIVWQFHYLNSPLLMPHPQRLLKQLKIGSIGLKENIDLNVTWHNPFFHRTPNRRRL
jgi:hypothetical protein